MQSINQNMNILKLCDKRFTRVNASNVSETFSKASPSHSAPIHNLYNDNNSRFIGTRITDNTWRTTRRRHDEERKLPVSPLRRYGQV